MPTKNTPNPRKFWPQLSRNCLLAFRRRDVSMARDSSKPSVGACSEVNQFSSLTLHDRLDLRPKKARQRAVRSAGVLTVQEHRQGQSPVSEGD